MISKKIISYSITVLILVAIIFGIQTLITLKTNANQPDCIFTDSNKVCNVYVPLREGQIAESYQLQLDFDVYGESAWSQWQQLRQLDTKVTDEQTTTHDKTYHWYLFGFPDIPLISEIGIKSDVTVDAFCDTFGEEVIIYDWHFLVDKPYDSNVINICNYNSPSDCLVEWDTNVFTNRDYTRTVGLNLVNQQEITSCNSDDGHVVVNKNMQSIIPRYQLVDDLTKQKVVYVVIFEELRTGGIGQFVSEPKLQYRYREFLYPSNLKIYVEDTRVMELQGVQSKSMMVDITSSVNLACDRENNANACEFKVTFISDSTGKMWVTPQTSLVKSTSPVTDVSTTSIIKFFRRLIQNSLTLFS